MVTTFLRCGSVPLAAVALCLSWAGVLSAESSSDARLSRPAYVQMATSESITIVWRTVGTCRPVIRYGTQPDRLDQSAAPQDVVTRVSPESEADPALPRLHSAPPNTWQYEARVTGLEPATTYYYAIYDGDRLLVGGDETYRFATLPKRRWRPG